MMIIFLEGELYVGVRYCRNPVAVYVLVYVEVILQFQSLPRHILGIIFFEVI